MNSPEKSNKSGIEYPKVTTFDVVAEYWKSAKKYWLYGVVTFIGVAGSAIAQSVFNPIYYKKFFDTLSSPDIISMVDSTHHLTSIIFTILALNIIGWISFRIAMQGISILEARVMADSRQRAFDYLIDHSHAFFSNNFTGSLVQKINRFSKSFERIYDRIAIDVVPLIIKVSGTVIVLYIIEPRIAHIMMIWIVVFTAFSFIFSRIKQRYDIRAAKTDSRVSATISDAISNHSSIQFFANEKEESDRFNDVNSLFKKHTLFRWMFANTIDAVQALFTIVTEFVFFYYGIKYWQSGFITLGTFVLIQSYIIAISSSLWNFGRIVRDLYEATSDAKEMMEILHLPHEIQDIPDATKLQVEKGAIEFKNVDFTFGKDKENQKPVFTALNLSIKAGEKVALIGSSGAGKSTLVKLLLRLHDIKGGEILIDGQNIRNVTQESLRGNISLVPQDPALFHRTLMENIRYGRRDATDEQVTEASKHAHCDIFIKDFPYKYETYVGERGVKLSGGERQRVAIARALLKNAPILVLDEATSSLDSHSESLIQDALHTLMEGKTTLVIAHRLSTIRKMDRIIVLGKDGIIEEGNHEELLKKSGTYYKLWNLQAGGFSNKSIEELFEE